MSANHQDLLCLSNLLLPDQIGQHSLENISSTVHKQFPKTEHFKICRILVFLLNHDFLYDAVSRFAALFIIWDMYRSEPWAQNPFTDFISSYVTDDAVTRLPLPALFVLHSLLSHPEQIHEFSKYTPVQIINLPVSATSRTLDWGFLRSESQNTEARLPQTAACGIPCVIPDKDVSVSSCTKTPISNQLRRHCLESLLSQNEPVACKNSLKPEFLQVVPPLFPCPQSDFSLHSDRTADGNEQENEHFSEKANVFGCSEELIWLYPPAVQHDFHWDSFLEQPTESSELRSLLAKALHSTLTQSEQQTILQMISEYPLQVHNFGVTPENLPQMVNCNPIIAIEILASLSNTPQMDEYYNALVSMEVTVDSLEIVNRLSSRINLPKEFIHAYISKCMNYCQSLQDKSSQLRLVRLVCLLIQSFVRNKILDIHSENILIEVQVFCVEFNKVNGANQLYRLIKNMESNPPGAPSPSQ